MIKLQRLGHILIENLLEIVWERPNVQQIFAQGRADGDRPITFDPPPKQG